MRAHLLLVLLGLLLFPAFVQSAGPGAARKQIEASLTVTGSIDISAAGDVLDYRIDQPEKIAPMILDLIERTAPNWKFEPVSLPAGADRSRSDMRLLFVAKRTENGDFAATLQDASFWAPAAAQQQVAIERRGILPKYPNRLQRDGVSGTVYLLLKVGRDGKVVEIDASHVNLRTIGPATSMAGWRESFARSSIEAVKNWSFVVPTAGPANDDPYWYAVLPISFDMEGRPEPAYGKWETYLPGPRKVIPWRDPSFIASDAMAPNSLHRAGQGPRLRTPLSGS